MKFDSFQLVQLGAPITHDAVRPPRQISLLWDSRISDANGLKFTSGILVKDLLLVAKNFFPRELKKVYTFQNVLIRHRQNGFFSLKH